MAYITVNDSISATVDLSGETRELTTKDSSGLRELAESTISASFNLEGVVDGSGYDDTIEAAYLNRETIGIKWNSGTVGDTEYECNGLITGFTRGGGLEDNEAYSATFVSTGPVTATPIT